MRRPVGAAMIVALVAGIGLNRPSAQGDGSSSGAPAGGAGTAAARVGQDPPAGPHGAKPGGPGPAELGAQLALPAGWRALPELAGAVEPGTGAVRLEARAGFGDPAMGCFALLQRVSAPASTDLARAVTAQAQALVGAGFRAESDGGSIRLSGGGVEGRIAIVSQPSAGERVAALSAACFYNDREPDRCRARCDALIDSFGFTP